MVDSLRLPEHSEDSSGPNDESKEVISMEQNAGDEAAVWEYRTSVMVLVNALTNSPEDVEERLALREEFSRRGLNEAMVVSSFESLCRN